MASPTASRPITCTKDRLENDLRTHLAPRDVLPLAEQDDHKRNRKVVLRPVLTARERSGPGTVPSEDPRLMARRLLLQPAARVGRIPDQVGNGTFLMNGETPPNGGFRRPFRAFHAGLY